MFGWFLCCGAFHDETEVVHNPNIAAKSRWKYGAVSLRGHLVRTYNHGIERDFYIDREHELGKGGCGVVVVGEHKETHQQYAIKIVNKATAERGRLDRELKLMKDVDHANIVRLFSVYDVPGNMYFVMELCHGGHLGNLLSRQSLKYIDEDWAKNLCRQLLSAVAHIHSRGIAHRDIKLQNILIDSTNDRTAQLKLIDFGYGSRFVGALPMRTKCGTPYTTAPEVIRECYDERCDIWSCGVVLYIMLCGRRPFEALDIAGPLSDAGKAAMITNILAGRFHFNHKPWQQVSKGGINFVKTLLHHDYRTRIRAYEALEHAWFQDNKIFKKQTSLLTSAPSFRAINNMRRSGVTTDMQRTGMVALVFGINSRSAIDLRAVFQSFDRDGSGTISKDEFHQALAIITPELTQDDISRLFDIVDIDHNGTISYTEFLAATLDPREVDMEELSKAFKLLDEDGNGFITKDELKKVVKVMLDQTRHNNDGGPSSSSNAAACHNSYREEFLNSVSEDEVDAKVNEIFQQVDINNDGSISLEEFFMAMTGMDSTTTTTTTTQHKVEPSPFLHNRSLSSSLNRGMMMGSSTPDKKCRPMNHNSGNSSNNQEDGQTPTMTRTSSTTYLSSRPRTVSYSFQSPIEVIDEHEPALPSQPVNLSQRHSISVIRMSSSRRAFPTVIETSEPSTSSSAQPLSHGTSQLHAVGDPVNFSGLLAHSLSHRSILPTQDDFAGNSGPGSNSPRPVSGNSNLVIYGTVGDGSSVIVEPSGHGNANGDKEGEEEEEIDESDDNDPSSSSVSSYDNSKVRSLFGAAAVVPTSMPLSMSTTTFSKKVLLPPIARTPKSVQMNSDMVQSFDNSIEYEDKSGSKPFHLSASGRSSSLLGINMEYGGGGACASASARIKKTPSYKRDLSTRFTDVCALNSSEERVDGEVLPSLGLARAQSVSSMLKSSHMVSGDESEDFSAASKPSGMLASFSRILQTSGKH
eukprot:gene319-342_t